MIDNDFHPDDRLQNDADHGYWKDIYEARPQASLGGRSPVEANNPEVGPTDVELRSRQRDMEIQRRKNVK